MSDPNFFLSTSNIFMFETSEYQSKQYSPLLPKLKRLQILGVKKVSSYAIDCVAKNLGNLLEVVFMESQ